MADDRYLVISADCHAGLPTEQYRPYLEAKHHAAFDDFLGERGKRLQEMQDLGLRNEEFEEKWFAENEEGLPKAGTQRAVTRSSMQTSPAR